MSDENSNFHPGEFTTSKLHFFSIGIVAANKALASREIEVTPVEELPMLDGEISTNADTQDTKATDASGKAYSASVQTQVTIKATWLRFGSANRMTPPDVRRGEVVMIYQFGDADSYYWVVLKDDSRLRKLETVIWAISATTDESKPTDASVSYYFEVSSHNKLIHIHTSKANEEPFEYDIQLNTGEGSFTITDDAGNYVRLDSAARRIELKNSDGTHFDLDRGILKLIAPDSIACTAPSFSINAETVKVAASNTSISGETALEKAAISGAMSVGGFSSLNGGHA